jgi:signal peptidase I
MSDNHDNPFGQDNPFAAPEPERFEAPQHPEPRVHAEEYPRAEHPAHEDPVVRHEEPMPVVPVHAYVPSSPEPYPPADARLIGTEPLLPADPLLPSDPGAAAVAAPPERLALDGTSLWLNRLGEELVAWLKTLASAAVYATLIVTFGFQVARVEGMSMAPTLQDQDRLIVNKLAYRIGDPKVGDIVMLYYPLKPEKSFVKRIIAEEGDQVRIVDGRVFRNDVPLDDSFVPQEYRSHDDWGPQVIPEGYYFVMGDHRNNSSDSRHWGFVPKKYIIGKVQLRWWPMGHAQVF